MSDHHTKPVLPWWEMLLVWMLVALAGLEKDLHALGLYALAFLWLAFVPVAMWLHTRAMDRWQDTQQPADNDHD